MLVWPSDWYPHSMSEDWPRDRLRGPAHPCDALRVKDWADGALLPRRLGIHLAR